MAIDSMLLIHEASTDSHTSQQHDAGLLCSMNSRVMTACGSTSALHGALPGILLRLGPSSLAPCLGPSSQLLIGGHASG